MTRQGRLLSMMVLTFCLIVLAFSEIGCNERRSSGQKPTVPSEDESSGGGIRSQAQTQRTIVDDYEHVEQKVRFEGGVEPDQNKAHKLVNQLYNYCVGLCSENQECPADLDAAKEGTRKRYGFFWPKDPWGKFYQYKRIDEQTCDVWSSGPDGKDGTEDDIHISDKNRAVK